MDNSFKLDEITCNDINIDQLYSLTNHTHCRVGGEYLYNALKHPVCEETVLKKRDKLCDVLAKDKELKKQIDISLSLLGNETDISVFSCVETIEKIEIRSTFVNSILSIILLLAFVLMIILDSKVMLFLFIFLVPVNMIYYFKCKDRISNHIKVFKFFVVYFKNISKLTKIKDNSVSEYINGIHDNLKTLKKIKHFSFFLFAGRKATGGFTDLFLDYIRMLFHVDIIKFYSMLKQLKNNKKQLLELLNLTGELDMISSTVTFRENLPYYSKPVFSDKLYLEVKDIYHPYLKKPIPNSITTEKSVLITGSNATGKSTFIRAIGINAILSQTLYTSTSSYYCGPMFNIFSSMMISDNMLKDESYFVAELKAVKRMTLNNEKGFYLYLLDELLRGTNTNERVLASCRILDYLSCPNSMCFASTHDIILTSKLIHKYDNYYFNESYVNNELNFDYQLKEGVCQTTNALKLLKSFDFPKEIWKD